MSDPTDDDADLVEVLPLLTVRTQTRAVLAGAYKGRRASLKQLLTHTVLLDEKDQAVSVLCGRVELDSIADASSLDEQARAAAPTCQRCARQAALLHGVPWRVYHRAKHFREGGAVSPLCAKRPRALRIDKGEMWTLLDEGVTCPRCLKLIAAAKREKTAGATP